MCGIAGRQHRRTPVEPLCIVPVTEEPVQVAEIVQQGRRLSPRGEHLRVELER